MRDQIEAQYMEVFDSPKAARQRFFLVNSLLGTFFLGIGGASAYRSGELSTFELAVIAMGAGFLIVAVLIWLRPMPPERLILRADFEQILIPESPIVHAQTRYLSVPWANVGRISLGIVGELQGLQLQIKIPEEARLRMRSASIGGGYGLDENGYVTHAFTAPYSWNWSSKQLVQQLSKLRDAMRERRQQ